MNLSRDAIINLRAPPSLARAPAASGSPDANWQPPTLSFIEGTWHICQSTSDTADQRTAVNLTLSGSGSSEAVTLTSTSTHGDKSSTSEETPLDLQDGCASSFSSSSNKGTESLRWDVLAWGKEGQLEDWMIEDGDGWISDSSGERRADWRDSFVVVWVVAGEREGKGVVEVWNRFGKPGLRGETVSKIQKALKEVGVEGDLVRV
ncbi:hypothetical protein B0T16DRAFT_460338 [Cercophora newfieldiana]|uniref:Uncharacterized protein n=1 Tax=Cercophora newfieldiana TaxID=92897 RepID=A0AA39Y362_9PEZI|nr:hypothetical protein B0T16DRAFT_460338 [Cercophora newfieldiana]